MTQIVNKLDYLIRNNQKKYNLMKNQTISISDEEYNELYIRIATIKSIEYATFSSDYALDFSAESGLTVYTAAVNEAKTKVIMREVPSKLVPANTAVVLHGAAGNYTGIIIASADTLTNNELQIATENMSGAGNNIFVLNKKDGVVGFYKLSKTGTLDKGKAYIPADTDNSSMNMSEE